MICDESTLPPDLCTSRLLFPPEMMKSSFIAESLTVSSVLLAAITAELYMLMPLIDTVF